jgi:hypothetical protein
MVTDQHHRGTTFDMRSLPRLAGAGFSMEGLGGDLTARAFE